MKEGLSGESSQEHQAPEAGEASKELRVIDGISYHKIHSGYTIREYFSHSTEERGPGPGWDHRWFILPKLGVDPTTNPRTWPDEPYYIWEPVEDSVNGENIY